MTNKIPHVIPYQGSKRKLAKQILSYIDFTIDTFYEPFAGSAAITLAAAKYEKANKYYIADKLDTLAKLWDLILNDPNFISDKYEEIWNLQHSDPKGFFIKVRERYNEFGQPQDFLYLIARSVKNAIRFNNNGEFNQSCDNRRLGTKPEKIRKEIFIASKLLKNRCSVRCADYKEILLKATPNDLVYMDPPWQGTSNKKNPRYAYLLNIDDLIEQMYVLNERNIPFLLSFDGICGDKNYGKELPNDLFLKKILLHAGRSSQATLLGRNENTIESLYLSPALVKKQQKK